MSGQVGPPRQLPDRVLTLHRDFLTKYPGAKQMTERARERCEDEMAWMEQSVDGERIVWSCWYGADLGASMGALVELSEALTVWDRAQP